MILGQQSSTNQLQSDSVRVCSIRVLTPAAHGIIPFLCRCPVVTDFNSFLSNRNRLLLLLLCGPQIRSFAYVWQITEFRCFLFIQSLTDHLTEFCMGHYLRNQPGPSREPFGPTPKFILKLVTRTGMKQTSFPSHPNQSPSIYNVH